MSNPAGRRELTTKGRMMDVVHEKSDLVFKLFLSGFGELFEILFKDPGAEDFHLLRFERKSSSPHVNLWRNKTFYSR